MTLRDKFEDMFAGAALLASLLVLPLLPVLVLLSVCALLVGALVLLY